jgi:hypothetical protein
MRSLVGCGSCFGSAQPCSKIESAFAERAPRNAFPKELASQSANEVEQVKAVRVKAHWQHWDTMAMAQALQFELMLRQKEVIGEWIPISEPGASKVTNDSERKWLMGLCWEQIDENLILRHNHSSEKGEDIKFDLKLAPMVLEEFALHVQTPIVRLTRAALPASGPMIICETTGYPYSTAEFRRKWRIVAKLAGIPDNIKNMDSSPAGMIFRGPDRAPPPRAIDR